MASARGESLLAGPLTRRLAIGREAGDGSEALALAVHELMAVVVLAAKHPPSTLSKHKYELIMLSSIIYKILYVMLSICQVLC